MRISKLSGREAAVVRCIEGIAGTSGLEIRQRMHMEIEDLVEILNALVDGGLVETHPMFDQIDASTFDSTMFDINPAYSHLV